MRCSVGENDGGPGCGRISCVLVIVWAGRWMNGLGNGKGECGWPRLNIEGPILDIKVLQISHKSRIFLWCQVHEGE